MSMTGKQPSLCTDYCRRFYTAGGESEGGAIYEAALLGATIAPFVTTEATVTDLALDVYDRKLFYIKEGSLFMSSLKMRETAWEHLKYSFKDIVALDIAVDKVAVDHHNRQVYVVGYDEDHHQWHLLRTDYNNNNSTLLFNGAELVQPFALGVFDGAVLWGSRTRGNFTVYSCKLSPACDIDHLEIVYSSQEAINDVKFYNSQVQTPDPDTVCEELSCSYNCTVITLYNVQCYCPPGLIVGTDGNNCVEDTAGLSTVWRRQLQQLLTLLTDELLQWLSPLVLIMLVCTAVLLLLCCALCLLTTPRPSSEAYDLSESRQADADTLM